MKYATLFLALLMIGCNGCTTDPPENDLSRNQLLGYWTLTQATRSGQVTESLEGLFFEFEAPETLTTNISGVATSATYDLDDGRLSHTIRGIEEDFIVQSLTDSVLVLTTKMRNYPFVFSFQKTEKPTPGEGHSEEI